MPHKRLMISTPKDETLDRLMEYFEPYVKKDFRTWANFIDMAIKRSLYKHYKSITPDHLQNDFKPKILTKKLKTHDIKHMRELWKRASKARRERIQNELQSKGIPK